MILLIKSKKEAYWVNEPLFWKNGRKSGQNTLLRMEKPRRRDDLSENADAFINQARVHDAFLDVMRHALEKSCHNYSRKATSP